MDKQIEYIAAKIKRLNNEIMQAVCEEKWFDSRCCEALDIPEEALEHLFHHIGDFLVHQDDIRTHELIRFVGGFGRKLIHSKIPLDQLIDFVYLTRFSILNLVEQELQTEELSIQSYHKLIKAVESVYQTITKKVLEMYNEEMSFIKHALEESNENLKMTLRELADLERALNEATIFAITDHEDKLLYANDNFCSTYKYSREELLGKKHDMFSSNFHPSSFFRHVWDTIESGEVWKGEILNQAKDGTKYWLDTTIIPFVDGNGKRYKHISIQYDITEKRNTEETLRKTEKLGMIGELAAGIAHEIRNPLTTIRGFVQLMNEKEIASQYGDTILDEIDRINFIVSEFMIFAKPHQIQFTDCHLTSILRSVIKFLEPEALLRNVNIEYDFPREEVCISGEKNQLKQVFLNLIKNSIEAMPSGGKIAIVVEKTDERISITIQDEGVGMKSEQVKKLGEPFFTTKEKGNGLGLMVSYKIIQNHNGMIHVSSELNEGTTFHISFENPQRCMLKG